MNMIIFFIVPTTYLYKLFCHADIVSIIQLYIKYYKNSEKYKIGLLNADMI